MPPADPFEEKRRRMVTEQIAARGIRDERVLQAMLQVPRHPFVPEELRAQSHDDHPLAIGGGQTISQPFMVALMTQLLQARPGSKILEIGTGSGYQAAVLAALGAQVFTIERIPELANSARRRLQTLGYNNVTVKVDDGSEGWLEEAPFDGILVAAFAPKVPEILVHQLAEGGRLVMPIGEFSNQRLVVAERRGGQLKFQDVCGCLFVPLIGLEGWSESQVNPNEQAAP